MLLTTAVFASILALMFIKLSFNVIGFRRKNKVSLGAGGVDELERAIRAHGNFAEYVPLGLFLIGALELNGAPWELVAVLGALLVAGRYFHAKGISEPPPNFTQRVRGMKLTFAALALSAIANVAWVVYRVMALA
ncbi:MAPEG family protein [Limnohabitans sp.]|uniref:MAPEG family protein n=1 Tax=Limnohabitans sp. TaxID=1907725 RepID=UPI00286F721F|nr:MAPEG family protein [Limnohabitans sp.]